MRLDYLDAVVRSEQRIRPFIRETPLVPSPELSASSGATVTLKLENLQHTGSFKARGALSKLLSLTAEERGRGIVTASTGNHGAAVAYGLGQLGVTGVIFVPTMAEPSKVERIRRLGGTVEVHGDDSGVTETYARRYAAERNLVFVSPYSDPEVIGGQGTVAVELSRQGPLPDVVFVAVGGGGLIGGIATYLRALDPAITIVGCSPENSKVMIDSVKAGAILDLPSLPTLSDGTAGGVESGAITFPLCRDLVQEYETVTEAEIADAMRLALRDHHLAVEGAAGVAIAAFRKQAARWSGKRVALVICGGNVGWEVLQRVVAGGR